MTTMHLHRLHFRHENAHMIQLISVRYRSESFVCDWWKPRLRPAESGG